MNDASFYIRYMVQFVCYQLITVVQVTLIILSIYQFNKIDTNDNHHISRNIKYMYMVVFSMGMLLLFVVEWFGIADFLHPFADIKNYCEIAAIVGNIALISYLFSLYSFYLTRLNATFNKSQFGISNTFYYSIIFLTCTVYIALTVASFLQNDHIDKRYVCFSWSFNQCEQIPICQGEFSIAINPMMRIILEIVIVFGNIFYGYLFYHKFHQIIDGIFTINENTDIEDCNTDIKKQLYDTYKKMKIQTTLVLVSTLSTLVFWTAANVLYYFGSYLQVFIYVDICINYLCLWLMLPWNEDNYNICCNICIKVNNNTLFRKDEMQVEYTLME
eukprot:297660_1